MKSADTNAISPTQGHTDKPTLTFSDAIAAINGKGPSKSGWYNGLCPAHTDSAPSLGIKEGADGTFAVSCKAGCKRGQVIAALEQKTGKRYGKAKKEPPTGLTLARYVEMKQVWGLFLQIFYQVVEGTYCGINGVGFPYYDENGTFAKKLKVRLSESSHDSRWVGDGELMPYGLATLRNMERINNWSLSRIVICEGESDTQTLVFNGIPALGIPGKKTWKPEFANLPILKNATEIFVVRDEPKADDFVAEVIASFPKGKAHKLILPGGDEGKADPSQLWLQCQPPWRPPAKVGAEEKTWHEEWQEAFVNGWNQAIGGAYDNSIAFSDTGNAERLVKAHGHNFRWVTDNVVFHVWDGTVWRRDKSGVRLLPQTKEVVRAIADPDWRLKSESSGKRHAMIEMAKGETPVHAESSVFDRHPMLLNVQNGTLDLETGNLREFRRDDFLTKQAQVSYVPFATCPQFDDFLDFTFNHDKETIQYMLKALGYTLTGRTGEHCFFICYGLGANGKSTLIEVMMQILGSDFATPAKFQTFVSSKMSDAKYEMANFIGARLVTAVEPRKAGHLDEEVLKQVTGGDKVMARQIYQEPVKYYPEFKLWLAMNNRPRIIGTDDGIWRRVHMIPFSVRVPESRKVRDYHKVLFAEEGPGILNRLLEGCQAWLKEGLQMSGAVRRVTDEFRLEQNVIQGFFDSRTVSAKPNQHAKAGDLYQSYKRWAEENGEFVIRQNEFAEELERRSFVRRRVRNDGQHWFGVALKDAPAEAEESTLCFDEEIV